MDLGLWEVELDLWVDWALWEGGALELYRLPYVYREIDLS